MTFKNQHAKLARSMDCIAYESFPDGIDRAFRSRICVPAIVKNFTHKNLNCMIVRYKQLNGYVSIPRQSELYGKHYRVMGVKAHNGLTYSRFAHPFTKERGNLWWVGFDTGHDRDNDTTQSLEFVEWRLTVLANRIAYLLKHQGQ